MKAIRKCVFCGNKPIDKTTEHVVPLWLIEMTGDPSRIAHFGPIWNEKTKKLETRQFAFDSLKFPACKDCNSTYSKLENQTKLVIAKVLKSEEISITEASTLLSWFDKIRIGMWLGLNYWRSEVSDIEPHMYVSSRIDMTDRCVLIYYGKSRKPCLNLIGLQLPAFHYTPCCFSMLVNHVGFFNLAGDFLISKRLGLPYPKRISWGNWPEVKYGIVPGKKSIELPLITKTYDNRCIGLYQPIAARYRNDKELWKLYSEEYESNLMLDETRGIGKIFIEMSNQFKEMTINRDESLVPQFRFDYKAMVRMLEFQTIDFQLYMHHRSPSEKTLKEPRKSIARMQRKFSISFARAVRERLTNK